jgi:murein DD-endopeptidase MepM/ murein hydrolase activator NlpD
MGSGEVTRVNIPDADYNSTEAHYILVEMDDGFYIWYEHMATGYVEEGQRVEANTPIGQYGTVGNRDPLDFDHLHVQFQSTELYNSHFNPAGYWPGGEPTSWYGGTPQ